MDLSQRCKMSRNFFRTLPKLIVITLGAVCLNAYVSACINARYGRETEFTIRHKDNSISINVRPTDGR